MFRDRRKIGYTIYLPEDTELSTRIETFVEEFIKGGRVKIQTIWRSGRGGRKSFLEGDGEKFVELLLKRRTAIQIASEYKVTKPSVYRLLQRCNIFEVYQKIQGNISLSEKDLLLLERFKTKSDH